MGRAKSSREKELISVVSMLDLDDSVAEIMIREKIQGEPVMCLLAVKFLKGGYLKYWGWMANDRLIGVQWILTGKV